MISTAKANSILDDIFRSEGTAKRYLGFSTTTPELDKNSGIIAKFTEPNGSTGYKRVPLTEEALSEMDRASGAKTTNSKYNIAFPVPNKESMYGAATYIGVFETEKGGNPTIAAKLSEPQTLGLKATLVIYKNDFTATLKATDTTTTTDTTSNAAG